MRLKQIMGTTASKAKAAPTICLGYFNGRIYFNAPTAQLLALKEGDNLAFFQDEDIPADWYFTKSTALGSGKLKTAGNSLSMHNCGIARPILQSRGLSDSANFFISSEMVEGKYFKILNESITSK